MIIRIIILYNGWVNFFTAMESWEGRELLNVNTYVVSTQHGFVLLYIKELILFWLLHYMVVMKWNRNYSTSNLFRIIINVNWRQDFSGEL